MTRYSVQRRDQIFEKKVMDFCLLLKILVGILIKL